MAVSWLSPLFVASITAISIPTKVWLPKYYDWVHPADLSSVVILAGHMKLELDDGGLVFLISAPLAMILATTHHVVRIEEGGWIVAIRATV